jgi:hypothetical protein
VFTVTLTPASGQTVTVLALIVSGTATELGDYAAPAPTTLTFSPGVTTRTFTVPVNGDALSEPSETFLVTLSNPTNATIDDGEGVGTIEDDDGAPTLSIGDVTLAEGNDGTTNFVFTVTINPPSGQTVTVQAQTADGTATAGGDYAATGPVTLTFGPRATSQTFTVPVTGDTLGEPDESFAVNLSSAINATIARPQGVGTIVNDDSLPTLSIDDVSLSEGTGGTTSFVFTVTLSATSAQQVTFQAQTADGNATVGSDYTGLSLTTFTIAPGATTQKITILVDADAVAEPNENFAVNLSGATNAAIARPQGVGTIFDDDGVPAPR